MKGRQRKLASWGSASTTPESGNCNPTRKFASREARSGDLETEEIARQTMLMARVVAKRISNWLAKEPGNRQTVLTNQAMQKAWATLRHTTSRLLVVT